MQQYDYSDEDNNGSDSEDFDANNVDDFDGY